MKKNTLTFLAIFGLFALGWFCGQKSATKPAGELINNMMYGEAFDQVTYADMVIRDIDSGNLDEAKQDLQLQMDGNILTLNAQSEQANSEIPLAALKILAMMETDSDKKYGSKAARADKLLARVAKYRQEHPWTYSGKNPMEKNAEVEAKLAAILQKATATAK